MRFSSLLISLTVAWQAGLAGETAPFSFVLEDQFGHEHKVVFPSREALSVFVLADRHGSAEVRGWVEPLYRRYETRPPIRGVAALPDVPPFVQGILRSMFRRHMKQPLLLDWGFRLSHHFGYSAGQAIVLLLNRDGQVVHRDEGPASPEKLDRFFQAIDAFLEATRSPE